MVPTLLVDDHLLVRRGFRRMLEDEPDIRVVAEAGDGQQAIDAAIEFRPDVVVIDFALPSMNGALATRRIVAEATGWTVWWRGRTLTAGGGAFFNALGKVGLMLNVHKNDLKVPTPQKAMKLVA